MRVWLLHIGEQLPIDGVDRLYRYGMLAQYLLARGHEVVRWAPTFVHATKSFRCEADKTVQIEERYSIKLLHARGYRSNVSLRRLWFHRQLARKFSQHAPSMGRPDLIVSALPTPEFCEAAILFARHEHLPIVIDIRDLWPEIYLDAFPAFIKPLARLALIPFRRRLSQALSKADGLTGVSEAYLNWGLRCARRPRGIQDKVFYIGYKRPQLAEKALKEARTFWQEMGIQRNRFTCIFFGTLVQSIDLNTVIKAARELPSIHFLICGDGAYLPKYRELASKLENVIFPGWVNLERITALMEFADVALAPYSKKARQSLPNKPFEYMAAGLPIISTLPGEMAEIISKWACGINYDPGDSQQLVRELLALSMDKTAVSRMRSNARHLFDSLGDANRIYPSFVQYLEEMVNGQE